MDLSTIRQNLNDNYYDDPQEVHSDVKLMFKNCYLFNPPGTPVAAAGKALQNIWDEKWRAMPVKEDPVYESESEEEQGNSDDESEFFFPDAFLFLFSRPSSLTHLFYLSFRSAMDLIGQQMALLAKKLDDLRSKKSGSKKHKSSSSSHKKSSSSHHNTTNNGEPRPKGSNTHPKTAKHPKPVPANPPPASNNNSSSSYLPPPPPPPPKAKKTSTGGSAAGGGGGGSGAPKKAKKPKKQDEDFSDDEGRSATVTMAQKQELADKIQVADGEILNQAIVIIQQSMPLGDVSRNSNLFSSHSRATRNERN